MNSGDLLVDRLRRLDTDTSSDNDDVPARVPDDPGHPSSLQHAGDRYGFRLYPASPPLLRLYPKIETVLSLT
jgi:hypothetical protein